MLIKTKLRLLFILLLIIGLSQAYAQTKAKKDTIYYLLDTLNTPPLERMIKTEASKDIKFYTIMCPCLKDNVEPAFQSAIASKSYVNNQVFKTYRLISLANLILFVKKNDNKQFNNKYIIYFIEPDKNGYIKRKMFFLGGGIEHIDDTITVPTGKS